MFTSSRVYTIVIVQEVCHTRIYVNYLKFGYFELCNLSLYSVKMNQSGSFWTCARFFVHFRGLVASTPSSFGIKYN